MHHSLIDGGGGIAGDGSGTAQEGPGGIVRIFIRLNPATNGGTVIRVEQSSGMGPTPGFGGI